MQSVSSAILRFTRCRLDGAHMYISPTCKKPEWLFLVLLGMTNLLRQRELYNTTAVTPIGNGSIECRTALQHL